LGLEAPEQLGPSVSEYFLPNCSYIIRTVQRGHPNMMAYGRPRNDRRTMKGRGDHGRRRVKAPLPARFIHPRPTNGRSYVVGVRRVKLAASPHQLSIILAFRITS
jgi:hypothetical protein